MATLCAVCKLRAPSHLAWYAAPKCPPRGLKLVCLDCAKAADDRPVPEYVFYFAPFAAAAKVLKAHPWSAVERATLRGVMN